MWLGFIATCVWASWSIEGECGTEAEGMLMVDCFFAERLVNPGGVVCFNCALTTLSGSRFVLRMEVN